MTSKQRAYLRSLAMTMDPIFQIGKSSLTPEFTNAIGEALEAVVLMTLSGQDNDKKYQERYIRKHILGEDVE